MTDYSISPLAPEDGPAIIAIFNYYVDHSFAAYPETPLPAQAFALFLEMSKGYPSASVRDQSGAIVGFGMLRPHNTIATFSRSAEATYFIRPDHTGHGLGTALLAHLEKGAREKGITTILASISSLNPGSIEFHRKRGFAECGRFRKVGTKKGRDFDTVWMQKML